MQAPQEHRNMIRLRLIPGALALLIAVPAVAQEQPVYKNVPSASLERILGELKIQYKKTAGDKAGFFYYEFERKGYRIRLHNYAGKDLWLEALSSDRLSLKDVNRWNQQAKFSRCVLLTGNGKMTVSLESQLDCLGGVTDATVRQFIRRFDGEVRDFAMFVNDTLAR
jgi:hypothetical protein